MPPGSADQLDAIEQPRIEPDHRVAGRRDDQVRTVDADAAAGQEPRSFDRTRCAGIDRDGHAKPG
jgi:hypothetical protein